MKCTVCGKGTAKPTYYDSDGNVACSDDCLDRFVEKKIKANKKGKAKKGKVSR